MLIVTIIFSNPQPVEGSQDEESLQFPSASWLIFFFRLLSGRSTVSFFLSAINDDSRQTIK